MSLPLLSKAILPLIFMFSKYPLQQQFPLEFDRIYRFSQDPKTLPSLKSAQGIECIKNLLTNMREYKEALLLLNTALIEESQKYSEYHCKGFARSAIAAGVTNDTSSKETRIQEREFMAEVNETLSPQITEIGDLIVKTLKLLKLAES
jgi:hypothetical protein